VDKALPKSAMRGAAQARFVPWSASLRRHSAHKPRLTAATIPARSPIVPAPAPVALENAPRPKVIRQKRGLPITLIAIGLLGVVGVGGGALYWLGRGATLLADVKVDANGRERLAVTCKGCPKGTKLRLLPKQVAKNHEDSGLGPTTEVIDGRAEITLPEPLMVGENPIRMRIERPGPYRNHELLVPAHLDYRVAVEDQTRAVPSTSEQPRFRVRFEAAKGTDISVEDTPIQWDGQVGIVNLPLGTLAQGPSDAAVTFERTLKFRVKRAGVPDVTESLPLRTQIVPMRVDTPRAEAILSGTTLRIAGKTINGATVSLLGKQAAVKDGSFELQLDAEGISKLEASKNGGKNDPADAALLLLSVTHPNAAARTVRLPVYLEGRFENAAAFRKMTEGKLKAWEESSVKLAEALEEPTKHAGSTLVFSGKLVDERALGGGFVALFDASPCAVKTCMIRSLLSQKSGLAPGARAKAFTTVIRPFSSPDGSAIPEVSVMWIK
jgi:hypothetical protein